MKNFNSVLMMHLILYKDVRDNYKNARIKCLVLLFKSFNIIKYKD